MFATHTHMRLPPFPGYGQSSIYLYIYCQHLYIYVPVQLSLYLPLSVIKCFSARSCLHKYLSRFSVFSSFSLLENKLQDERAIKVQLNAIAKSRRRRRNTHKHAHTHTTLCRFLFTSLSHSLCLSACLFRFQMMINGCLCSWRFSQANLISSIYICIARCGENFGQKLVKTCHFLLSFPLHTEFSKAKCLIENLI